MSDHYDTLSDDNEVPDRWEPCNECGKRWPPELLKNNGGACSAKCSKRRRDRLRYRDKIAKQRGGKWEDVRSPVGRKKG